jgi:hypothetical protein
MRSFDELQYEQNDTNCSFMEFFLNYGTYSLAYVLLKLWPLLIFFQNILRIAFQKKSKITHFKYEVIWRIAIRTK